MCIRDRARSTKADDNPAENDPTDYSKEKKKEASKTVRFFDQSGSAKMAFGRKSKKQ